MFADDELMQVMQSTCPRPMIGCISWAKVQEQHEKSTTATSSQEWTLLPSIRFLSASLLDVVDAWISICDEIGDLDPKALVS